MARQLSPAEPLRMISRASAPAQQRPGRPTPISAGGLGVPSLLQAAVAQQRVRSGHATTECGVTGDRIATVPALKHLTA